MHAVSSIHLQARACAVKTTVACEGVVNRCGQSRAQFAAFVAILKPVFLIYCQF